MKYSVDRVENDKIILENLETKVIKVINKNDISFNVSDGDILLYENNKYIKDVQSKIDRLKLMQEKFNKVKGE
jgi:hypothetical protein